MAFSIFQTDKFRLKRNLSVRARLVLLTLILVAPLMLDRVRVLEGMRTADIKAATKDLADAARQGSEAQNALISSVDGFLKTAAYIYAVGDRQGTACSLLQSVTAMRFEWIQNLSIVGADGIVKCSTLPRLIGIGVGDRPYFQKAVATRQLVISDYVLGRAYEEPMLLAAYPTSSVDSASSAVLVASVNLKWVGQLMASIRSRNGSEVLMLDGKGVVIGARGRDEGKVGQHYDDPALIDSVTARDSGSYAGTDPEGHERLISFARIPASDARLIVSSDEAITLAAIDRDIMTAYLQFAIVSILVLLGAWLVSERLIIRPIQGITAMATRFGQGDLAVRATRDGLPAEFKPLATAFNVMAAQLSARDAELRASNNRLTVLASLDVVSGVANRRGFESRLEFEWLKAKQAGTPLALTMIDVDYFKLFNDTYGHPKGDICLRMIGEALAELANDIGGFPARYGGEEFLLLLPNCDSTRASAIAERARLAVESLAIPHLSSHFGSVTVSVGVATASPWEGDDPSSLVVAADSGLYAAKRRGRNTVVEHGAIHTVELASIAV